MFILNLRMTVSLRRERQPCDVVSVPAELAHVGGLLFPDLLHLCRGIMVTLGQSQAKATKTHLNYAGTLTALLLEGGRGGSWVLYPLLVSIQS